MNMEKSQSAGSESNKLNDTKNIKGFYVWLFVLFSLVIKSEALLVSLYGLKLMVLLVGALSLIPILLLISFSFCFRSKGFFAYLFLLDLLISLLYIIDLVYARAFDHLISINMIIVGDTFSGMKESVFSLFHFADLLMLIDFPILFIRYKKASRNWGNRKISHFIFTLFVSILITIIGYQYILENNALAQKSMRPLILSPLGDHIYDLYRFTFDRNKTLTETENKEVIGWIQANQKYLDVNVKSASMKGLISNKNIVIIQWESLENFAINARYEGHEITPNLNEILYQSIYFNNIIEQVQDGNSSDAELIFNTSIYPISSGSAFLRFGENNYNSLPKLLNQRGYTSIAIHGDGKDFWNRDIVFPKLGYNRFIDESMFANQDFLGMGISDQALFEQIINEIKQIKQPFSLYAITLSSHLPFESDESFTTFATSKNDISSQYLRSLHYTDMAFGYMIDQLNKSKMFNNTVIVIYGDHEGIHKYSETKLPDNNKRVPFIICIPGFDGYSIDKIGGQIDIMPTLAFLLGIERTQYENDVMGRNLFGDYSGSGIYSSGNIEKGTDGIEHLRDAFMISDLIIKSNYFDNK